MELSKCNLDLIIQKSTLVTSEMRGFSQYYSFPFQNICLKLEVIGDIQENENKK